MRCPLHTTTNRTGAISITDCVCDTINHRFLLSHHLCTHGAECCGCEPGWFYSEATESCAVCAAATFSAAGATECYLCAAEHYLLNLSAKPSSLSCLPCPFGLHCKVGCTVENATLLPGWWRLTNRTTDLRQCEKKGNVSGCLGGASFGRCVGEAQTGPECKEATHLSHAPPTVSSATFPPPCCYAHLWLALAAMAAACALQVCEERSDFYKSGHCLECPAAAPRILRAIGILLLLSLLAGAPAAMVFAPSSAPAWLKPHAFALRHRARDCYRFFKALNMQPKFKVVVTFYQVVTVVDSVYSISAPENFTSWMDVFRFVGFDWSALILPAGCI